MIVIQNCFQAMVWLFIYYYLLTYYLQTKLQFINKHLNSLLKLMYQINSATNNSRGIIPIEITKLIKQLTDILLEIQEYNNIFWAKYLGIFWFSLSSLISMSFYMAFLSDANIIVKIAIFMIFVVFCLILVFIIHISALIYKEPNESYKLLNSLSCELRQTNGNLNVFLKLKVIHI